MRPVSARSMRSAYPRINWPTIAWTVPASQPKSWPKSCAAALLLPVETKRIWWLRNPAPEREWTREDEDGREFQKSLYRVGRRNRGGRRVLFGGPEAGHGIARSRGFHSRQRQIGRASCRGRG